MPRLKGRHRFPGVLVSRTTTQRPGAVIPARWRGRSARHCPSDPRTAGQKYSRIRRLAWQPNWQPNAPIRNDKRRHRLNKSPAQRPMPTSFDTSNETTDQKVGGSTPSERTQESPGHRGCPGPVSDAEVARWSHRWSHRPATRLESALHGFPCCCLTQFSDFQRPSRR